MKEFKKILEQTIEVLQDLNAIAAMKLRAARHRQVATIEECMTKEQACIMQMRGLEQKREQKKAALGFADVSFSEILTQLPEAEALQMTPVFEALRKEVRAYQEVKQNLEKVIGVNLYAIKKELEQRGAQGALYQNTGKTGGPSSTDRII